jgi:ubiquinone/menaquinone biosynthesis C-methylase UbiE
MPSDAAELHKNVPPDWYFSSMKKNPFQRFWHKSRFAEVEKFIDPVPGGKVLDIGCADGVFTKVILDKQSLSLRDKSKACEIIGIDVLQSSVDWANKHWKKQKELKFRVGDAHKLDFKANTFDAVFALEVMEHVFHPQEVFKEIKRVLKKNGYVIILVPSDNFLFNVIWWFVTKFWWARIWQDCHVQSFSAKHSLADELKKAGFKVEVDDKFLLGMLNLVKARKV